MAISFNMYIKVTTYVAKIRSWILFQCDHTFQFFRLIISLLFFSGVDVTANQEEISDHETFQLEYDDMSKRWYIRTMQDKYFTQKPGGGIQANEIRRYDISRFIYSVPNLNRNFKTRLLKRSKATIFMNLICDYQIRRKLHFCPIWKSEICHFDHFWDARISV